MKKMKKVVAFFLSAVMALAMSCTVFATSTDTGTPVTPIKDNKQVSMENHIFTAYQLFIGEQGDDHTIIKINWGDGINAEAFLAALKADSTIGSQFKGITYQASASAETGINRCADAIARVVSKWSDDSDYARAFARIADANKKGNGYAVNTTLKAGYYLVVDTTNFGSNFTGDQVKNLSILQMTAEHTFQPESKTGVPTLTKEVKEVNDSDVVVRDQWGDVADYDIGDDVEFRLTGTLPADYASYTKYKYVFHDTLGQALTFNDDVVVTVKNGTTETKLTEGQYTVVPSGQTFIVTIEDLKKLQNVTINANTEIIVGYTAKLLGGDNITYGTGITNTAYLEYSNNSNPGGDGETGRTPDDKVVVFTFKMVVNKIDENQNALAGAEFTLYKMKKQSGSTALVETNKTWTVVASGDGKNVFNFEGLDAGEYKLVETKVPDGYNQAEDMYFTVTATYTTDEVPSIATLTVSDVKDKDGNVIMDASDSTKKGFTISANKNNATLSTDIVNLKGILLPSTGGIGTTIFYVLGTILVLGAGILLVTRKRMSKSE